MLGVVLLFVGAVLINNGYCILAKVDSKSMSVMQILFAFLVFIAMILHLIFAHVSPFAVVSDGFAKTDAIQWYAAACSGLFAFTYFWQAAMNLWNVDARPYGVYCAFVAINAFLCAYLSYINFDAGIRMAVIWVLWGLLWLTGTIEINCGKSLGKFVPWFCIFCGVFTAWIPAIMMITGAW